MTWLDWSDPATMLYGSMIAGFLLGITQRLLGWAAARR